MSHEWISMYALVIGIVAFLVAALAYLIRETRAVPKEQRLVAMGTIAGHAVRRRLPSRHSITVAASGFGTFFAIALIGAAVSWGILEWYASTLPQEINVVAGAAQAMMLMFYFYIGITASTMMALILGFVVAFWVSDRLARNVG